MENTNESADNTPDSLIRINQIVNENLQKTWKLQAHTKYLKAECENLDKEIKDLKARIEVEKQTAKNLEENLDRALKFKDLEMYTIDLITKMHPQLVQRNIDEKNKLKEWTDTFEFTYDKNLKKFEQFKRDTEAKNPLLKELCTVDAEINKLEFDKKFLNEKIKDAKRTCKLKEEIYRKMFHAVIVRFVQGVSKYHHRTRVMNELKENEELVEHQHNQYKLKYLEAENKCASDNISCKIEIPKLNLQPSGNPMENLYQNILPTRIPLRSSYQNYEMPNTDISSILTKYKKRYEERNEMTEKIDLFTTKQSDQTTAKKSNEIKQKKIQQSAKRSFENAQLTKPVNRSFKQQKILVGNQTKPQGIIKKNVENENNNEQVNLSQKSVTKQVAFDMKDGNSKENAPVKDKIIKFNKSQENLAHSLTSSTKGLKIPVASTNFSFMLGNRESQTLKDTYQTVNTQNKKDLTFPTVMTSFGFGKELQPSRGRTATNKNPEQKTATNKNVEKLERSSSFLKPSYFNAMPLQKEQGREFSPYFKKSEPLRRESQTEKSNINEVQEKDDESMTTDLAECDDSEVDQYLSYEFLTPQEDELSATQKISFLGEDQHVNSGEEKNGFMFNLGQPSSQGSFKPFGFFN